MKPSSKVGAATLAAAVATIIWTLVAAMAPGTFNDAAITALTGASATVLAFVFGYFVPDVPDVPDVPAPAGE